MPVKKVTATPKGKDTINRMLHKLEESALDAKDAAKLKLIPTTTEQSEKLGLSRPGAGFKIPYFDEHGKLLEMYRYRYFDVTETKGFLKGAKLRKYDQPSGTDAEVYLPPNLHGKWENLMADNDTPLFITEGELKAACATKHGFPTIGLGGVFSFGSRRKNQQVLPIIERFKWKNRRVYICYDSDAMMNKNVLLAEQRLARELSELGAIIYVIRLPQVGDSKVGLDDFIVANGAEAFRALVDDTEPYSRFVKLHEMNTKVIYVKHPSMIIEYPKENHPPNQPRLRAIAPTKFVNEVYADESFMDFSGDNARLVKTAKEWVGWGGRSKVDSVCYEPAMPRVINNNQLNLWEGWGVAPKAGDVSLWHKLMENTFKNANPGERKWFEQWLAYPLQNPGAKLNTAVVIWSLTQGSGKSLIGYTMRRIYGTNWAELNKAELGGNHNGWAENRQFVMGEEITGGSGRDVADVLKSMITSQTVTINQKYVPTFAIKNCINYYFTSNHQDAFFVNQQDRRYFIHEIVGEKMSRAFFDAYDKWFKSDDGAGALFYYLLTLDLSDFNPQAEAPHTKSREDMIDAGMSEHAAWAKELRNQPDNVLRIGDVVIKHSLFTIEELKAIYDPEGKRRHISSKALAIALREQGFKKVANDSAIDLGGSGKHAVWAIRFKPEDRADEMTGSDASKLYQSERKMKVKSRKFSR